MKPCSDSRHQAEGPAGGNAAATEWKLSAEEVARLDAVFPPGAARGIRCPGQAMKALNR